jgi:FkbM family methyltransferase
MAQMNINVKQELEKYLSNQNNDKTKKAKSSVPIRERRVSLPKTWLTEGLKRTRKIWIGYKLKDKIKLTQITLLEMTPRFIRKNFAHIEPLTENLRGNLYKQLTIKLNQTIYKVPDSESIRILSSEFESSVTAWFCPKRDEVVVDIGAHIGKYSIEASKLVGDKGVVVAIEAIPNNYNIIKKNIELNSLGNIKVFNLAAWDSECTIKFMVGSTSATSNISRYNYRQGSIEVSAMPIDKLLIEQLKLLHVDWLKIDVEGAEYQVLSGLKQTLLNFKPKIIVEIWSQNIDKVQNLLKECNYRIEKISEFGQDQSQYYIEALCV